MVRRLILVLAGSILLLLGLLSFAGRSSPEFCNTADNKAAIIDQLNPTEPNPDFVTRSTANLENHGFKVDYFSGEAVTLDLYRRLPVSGYSLIIFRAHSGLLGNGSKANQETCLFSNQLYSQTSELIDQLLGRVVTARVDNDPALFGVNADFVRGSLHGQFKDTTIIMMGCSSLEKDDLAKAFIEKGAAAYCGWNTEVMLNYDEDVTLNLLAGILESDSLEVAVNITMLDKGPDPQTGAALKYYPDSTGNHALTGLLK